GRSKKIIQPEKCLSFSFIGQTFGRCLHRKPNFLSKEYQMVQELDIDVSEIQDLHLDITFPFKGGLIPITDATLSQLMQLMNVASGCGSGELKAGKYEFNV